MSEPEIQPIESFEVDQEVLAVVVARGGSGCLPSEVRTALAERGVSPERTQEAVVRIVSRGEVEVGEDWKMRPTSR